MAKVSPQRLLELLERSRLVEDERHSRLLADAVAKIKKGHGGKLPEKTADLADLLVEADVVTKWQATNLLAGKHKGFLLGNYKLLRHLGTGGMSSVYLAQHRKMGHKVAIKVLPPSRVEDSSYLARFQLEARAAAALNHPNIVRAIDIDQDGRTHYFVMEYVDGQDLQRIVKEEGPLDYERTANYLAQAADGLQHAHDANLIHRDVKPANLLVDKTETVKVLDMGLARFNDDAQPSLTIAHDENVLGTADYLAPEQAINSHGVDHRADIYSLGCTLYFLLTGHPPFSEGTLPQRLMKHQTEMPPSIFEDRPDAPQPLVNICLKMMVKTPESRYQRSDEVADDLRAWLEGSSEGPDPTGGGAGAPADTPRQVVGGSGGAKTLKTRKKSTPPPVPAPPPPVPGAGDTISSADSETFKGPPRRSRAGGGGSLLPAIDTGDSDAGMVSRIGAGRRKKEPAEERPERPKRVRSTARELAERTADSGSVVFDPTALAPADTSDAKSLLDARQRRSRPKTPIWIWVMMGAGVLLTVVLAIMMLNR